MTSTEITVEDRRPPSRGEMVEALKNQIKNGEMEFRAALPAHIPVERFMRVVTTAVTSNPQLLDADRRSLFESATKAAQDGLLPDGRDGALVVYNTKVKGQNGERDKWVSKVQWMPMISGVLKKIRNSGELASIDAQLVHANDKFSYRLGVDASPVHEPDWFGDRGTVVGVYAVAKLKDGSIFTEVMSRKQVEEVRAVSRAKDAGPWVQWWGEMARKTVLRRLAKRLPMSTDMDDLIRRDDALYDFDGAREDAAATRIAAPKTLAGRLDALAATTAHDAESGEIVIEQENGAGSASQAAAEEAGDARSTDPRDTAAAEQFESEKGEASSATDAGASADRASEEGDGGNAPAAVPDVVSQWRQYGAEARKAGKSAQNPPLEARRDPVKLAAWREGYGVDSEGAE